MTDFQMKILKYSAALRRRFLFSDGGNYSVLHEAIARYNFVVYDLTYYEPLLENIKSILDTGFNPNTKAESERTFLLPGRTVSGWYVDGGIIPLMLSTKLSVSDLLINYGSDVNAHDIYGRTALMLQPFLREGNDITSLLIRNGANVNIQDNTGQTALFYAIYCVNIEQIKLLIENGADVNIQDKKGFSPLFAANIRDTYDEPRNEMIELLKNAGQN
ncbi:hypothetical protein FACS189485_14460 [Spirochaetia bacterium]|nr:hypothetical protein FACS189485_14460 [Spirochaetia bacterium]